MPSGRCTYREAAALLNVLLVQRLWDWVGREMDKCYRHPREKETGDE